ncbi:hypothetical protein ACFYY5_29335 [Nocardia elegans]|uniref:Uncharacterized protein n=1 Tax=Nocardia elegans TaxID=300029 RepID=A0ABW6TLE9_9NOCA
MTSTEIAPASIEHLKHRPLCGLRAHQGEPTPATHWLGQHGCFDVLLCTVCLNRVMKQLREWLDEGREIECDVCHRSASTIEDLMTVRPL